MTHPFLSSPALGLVFGFLIGAAVVSAILRSAEID